MMRSMKMAMETLVRRIEKLELDVKIFKASSNEPRPHPYSDPGP
jgi:hypothetical protein